jgi:hypothetical protein
MEVPEGKVLVDEKQLNDLIEINTELSETNAKQKDVLKKILAAYEQLEKDGVVAVLEKMINSNDTSVMKLIAPIGRIIPKLKKYGDCPAINDVFNMQFFENAKTLAKK